MHLHAYLAQAIRPGSDELLQLPEIKDDDVATLGGVRDIKKVFKELLNQDDSRAETIKKACLRLGRLEVLDLQFKGSIHICFSKSPSHRSLRSYSGLK